MALKSKLSRLLTAGNLACLIRRSTMRRSRSISSNSVRRTRYRTWSASSVAHWRAKNAIKWTRLSCRKFDHNAVRLQLHALAYNLGNFMRTLALPDSVEQWSLTTLREKLIKIGARIVRHGRYVIFQMAEVAIPRDLFADILRRIDRLRPTLTPA